MNGRTFCLEGAITDRRGEGVTKPLASGGAPGLDLLTACPEQLPLASESDRVSCLDAVRCDYIDGSLCVCAPCDDGEGSCWSCALSSPPLGCPRAIPVAGESCVWNEAFCMYGDCQRWSSVIAACCQGQWRVGGDACVSQTPIP